MRTRNIKINVYLSETEKKIHYLGYFEDEEFLQYKLTDFNFWINKLKK